MRLFFILVSFVCMVSSSSCATRLVAKLSPATVIKTPPRHHKIIKVQGREYYYWNGKYYKKTRRGFVVTKI
jgi:hypothetical protein